MQTCRMCWLCRSTAVRLEICAPSRLPPHAGPGTGTERSGPGAADAGGAAGADAMGSPAMNFLVGTVQDGHIKGTSFDVKPDAELGQKLLKHNGQKVYFGIRPEDLELKGMDGNTIAEAGHLIKELPALRAWIKGRHTSSGASKPQESIRPNRGGHAIVPTWPVELQAGVGRPTFFRRVIPKSAAVRAHP